MAILVRGGTDFEQIGPAEWQPNGWDLDRLIVPYRGPRSALAAFIAGLTLWQASAIDGNMFLEDWKNDGHPVHPTVLLTYIGKKGGTLPPSRNASGYTVQQARFNAPQATGGYAYVHLTYIAPTSSKIVWGRSPVDIGAVGAATPVDAAGIAYVAEWNIVLSPEPDTLANAMAYFVQSESVMGDSEELVPGQYYRGTQVKQNILFSVGV